MLGQVNHVRWDAPQRLQPFPGVVQTGQGLDQAPGVGMAGFLEQGQHFRRFNDGPGVHHSHLVAHVRDHAHVVGDEQDGRTEVLAEVLETLQYLGLERHVQAGGCFVGDKELGPHDQGDGQHHPLAHPAAEGEGVLVHDVAGLRETQLFQDFLGHGRRGAARDVAVGQDDFLELLSHRLHRVQGGLGVLEHQGEFLAPYAAQVRVSGPQQVHAVKDDAPGRNGSSVGKEAHDGQSESALPSAAFSDEAIDLLVLLDDVDAVQRLNRPGVGVDVDVEVLDSQNFGHFGLPSVAHQVRHHGDG